MALTSVVPAVLEDCAVQKFRHAALRTLCHDRDREITITAGVAVAGLAWRHEASPINFDMLGVGVHP
jgi:hypothetical protein